jgi:UDP-MurNAc hydroxylase
MANSCINVKYIYSACIVTETPDLKVLHDPWFTEGIYDGAWYHFPRVSDPLDSIGDVDAIYISHIHPDHYDPVFLRSYFKKYGEKKIFIGNFRNNYLQKKMISDGFTPMVLVNQYVENKTCIEIIPCESGSLSDVDSYLILKYQEGNKFHCIVNANDVIFDDEIISNLKVRAGNVDIFLCGFTGAGPYPQTYFDSNDPILNIEAENKKKTFFMRYKKTTDSINAKINIPFAGKYLLGGKLSSMNFNRGVSDPIEVLDFDKKAIVLSDNGGAIDTASFISNNSRTVPYPKFELDQAIKNLQNKKMDYELLFDLDKICLLPLKRLLSVANKKAFEKSEYSEDYFICIHIPESQIALININRNGENTVRFINENQTLPKNRSEIFIDARYLFGLLTGIYHWNNAEIGSQYQVRRVPNIFNRSVQHYLNFLSV